MSIKNSKKEKKNIFHDSNKCQNNEFNLNNNNLNKNPDNKSPIKIEEINKKNEKGYTYIYQSILSNNIKLLKELLINGANPNYPNDLNEPPLFLSINNNNFDAFLTLLKYKADCNISNKKGETPLHIAIEKKEKKFIQVLLKYNANPNIKNLYEGKTPTHLAIINKIDDEEILNLLKGKNADIFYLKDKFNKSAFDYAKDLNNENYINLILKIFGYNNNTNNLNNSNIRNKNINNQEMKFDNVFLINSVKNKNNNNIDKYSQAQMKDFSNNNEYYIITSETNKNEFKLENNSNKESQNSNKSLLKNKIILTSDISSGNIQIKELNNSFENNSNLNKSKKSLSEFLTEEINIKDNKENLDTNSNNNSKNIFSQIYSQKSENSDFNKSQTHNPISRNSENIKNKSNNLAINNTNSNIYSNKSNISGSNSNTNSNIYLTNSVGANKKIIKNIIHDTIKKIIVKSISSSDDNNSKENIVLFSKESEQVSNTNSNIEDSKSKNSKNTKNSKSIKSNENKENLNNSKIENNIINLYENGKNSFLLFNSKNLNDIVNNDNITVSKLIKDESKTLKLNNFYDGKLNSQKGKELNEDNKDKNINDNKNNNINSNLNINEIKDNKNNKDNIFLETTNSNIFSELQIKSNNNYNITNNDISLSYSKNLLTDEDNLKNDENEENEKKFINDTDSNLDIKIYTNNNTNKNFKNKDLNKDNNIDNEINIEHHIKEKSNGDLNNKKIIKCKSFILNSLKNKNRIHNNSTLENCPDINDNYNGKNALLKKKIIKDQNPVNNSKSQIYYKHYRQLSYHLNAKPEKNNKKIKESDNTINNILEKNNYMNNKENDNPNCITLNNDKVYKNKNNLINHWYNNITNKSFKSSTKSKISNNISGINRTSKLSLTKSGSCQNMNPPPIEAIINKDTFISPSNKTISSINNQNSFIMNNNNSNNNINKNKLSITNNVLNNTAYTINKPKHSSINRLSNNNIIIKNIPINNSNNNIKYNPYNNYYEYESEESNNNINNKINKLKNIATNLLIRLREWLISCDLLCYYNLFISNDMYHIDSYINDLQEGKIPLNYDDLEKIGIRKPGHIFRILIKLDIDAGLIDNNLFSYINDKINFNSVTTTIALTSSESEIFCCGINLCPSNNNNYKKKFRPNAIYFNDLSTFLRAHDLVRFKGNFLHNGFDKIEFIIIQLFSKYPFNRKILNEYLHVYIDRDKIKILNILYMVKCNISKEFGINVDEEKLEKINYSSQKKSKNCDTNREDYYSDQFNSMNENYYNENSSHKKQNESNSFCLIF